MDIYAYLNIEDLSSVAEANGIDVPRLRGFRLMSQERPMTKEEIRETEVSAVRTVYENGCMSVPAFCPDSYWIEYTLKTEARKKRYLDENGDLRWELLHGKRRKNMKFAVKKIKNVVRKECEAWNRYAGREDVLYIRARIGGSNWNYFRGYELESKPWFLEKADEWFDETYCVIYAKIAPKQ